MAQKSRFPTAYTILFLITALVAALTWVMPAGKFATLSYTDGAFLVTAPAGEEQTLPATQDSLDQLGVTIPLVKFTAGDIKKPISVPGSYQTMKSQPQGLISLLQAPIKGIEQVVDLMVFVLMIGGLVGVVNKTGALDAGIAALTQRMAGRERWLIVLVISLTALGGTTFGLAEETIAFYPILIPVFLAARYDALVAVAAILLGSHIGTMASTVNPFATVIASNAAGINFMAGFGTRLLMLLLGTALCIVYLIRYAERVRQDPGKSLIADQQHANRQEYLHGEKVHAIPFTRNRKIILVIFALTFVDLIYGVTVAGWWMTELATLFFAVAILIGFFARMSEKTFISHFVDGARELLGVALIIGVARGVVVVMEEGLISATILQQASGMVADLSGAAFISLMSALFALIGIFIPSTSGLAVLSMPIMAPLGDVVSVPRESIVSAYQFGQGLMSFITPTSAVLMGGLVFGRISYNRWLKFFLPLMAMLALLAVVILILTLPMG